MGQYPTNDRLGKTDDKKSGIQTFKMLESRISPYTILNKLPNQILYYKNTATPYAGSG